MEPTLLPWEGGHFKWQTLALFEGVDVHSTLTLENLVRIHK